MWVKMRAIKALIAATPVDFFSFNTRHQLEQRSPSASRVIVVIWVEIALLWDVGRARLAELSLRFPVPTVPTIANLPVRIGREPVIKA